MHLHDTPEGFHTMHPFFVILNEVKELGLLLPRCFAMHLHDTAEGFHTMHPFFVILNEVKELGLLLPRCFASLSMTLLWVF
jgi:hypothetical protein